MYIQYINMYINVKNSLKISLIKTLCKAETWTILRVKKSKIEAFEVQYCRKNAKNSMDRKGKKMLSIQENKYSKINMEYAKTEKKSMDI